MTQIEDLSTPCLLLRREVLEAHLKASNRQRGDDFGTSVVVSGDMVVVGAPDEGGVGAAYVFAMVEGQVSDFDGDRHSDIFWRHTGDGRNKLWFMNGLTREAVGKVAKFGNTDWAVAGLGDFTGDGLTDVLWRNGVTGANKTARTAWVMMAHGTCYQEPQVEPAVQASANVSGIVTRWT